jgi:hypothetical protein
MWIEEILIGFEKRADRVSLFVLPISSKHFIHENVTLIVQKL